MSGETIRDVLIRVSIESRKSKLSLPDLKPHIADLGRMEKAYTDAFAAAREFPKLPRQKVDDGYQGAIQAAVELDKAMSAAWESASKGASSALREIEKVESAASKAASTISGSAGKVNIPNVGPAVNEIERIGKAHHGAGDAAKESGQKQASAAKKAEDRFELARKEVEKLNRDLTDSRLKALEGFRTMGEGAFTFARGLALVGISAEDDLAKVVEGIAKIQGGFDLFKGGIDVIKGMTEGLRALRAASLAAATAQSALAASSGASTAANIASAAASTSVATSSTNAAAGVGRLIAKFTPAAVAIGIVTASGHALAGVIRNIGRLSGDVPPPDAEKIKQGFDVIAEAAAKANYETDRLQIRLNRKTAFGADTDEIRKLESIRDQLSISEQIAEIDRERNREHVKPRPGLPDPLSMSELAQSRLAAAQKAAETPSVTRTILEEQKQKAMESFAISERSFRLDQNRLDLQKQQVDESDRALKVENSRLETAMRAVEQEKRRFESKEARAGLLAVEDPLKFKHLQQISQRQAAGEKLTLPEAKLLQDTDFGQNLAEQRFREEFKRRDAAGGGGFLSGLGEDQAFKESVQFKSNINQRAEELRRATQEERDALLNYAAATTESAETKRENARLLNEMAERERNLAESERVRQHGDQVRATMNSFGL